MSRKILKSPPFARSSSVVVGAGLALACWLGAERTAAAQARFGDKGQLVISAENLFSFSSERVASSPPTGDQSDTSTRFGFLLSGQRLGGMITPISAQVGGHYFIIPSLSLGGTIGYEARGGSHTQQLANGGELTTDAADESTFVFLPKVGYVLALNHMLSFWFRGGIGIGRVGTSGPGNAGKTSATYWLFSADALFTVSPFNHFAFYVGPQANLSFSGSQSLTNNNGTELSFSSSFRSIGIGTGIFGYVDL